MFMQNFFTVLIQLWKIARRVSLNFQVQVIFILLFSWSHIKYTREGKWFNISEFQLFLTYLKKLEFPRLLKKKNNKTKQNDPIGFHLISPATFWGLLYLACKISYTLVNIFYMCKLIFRIARDIIWHKVFPNK